MLFLDVFAFSIFCVSFGLTFTFTSWVKKKRFTAVVKILKILGWIMLGNYITYFVLDHIDPSLSGPTEISMELSNLTLIGVSSFFFRLIFFLKNLHRKKGLF